MGHPVQYHTLNLNLKGFSFYIHSVYKFNLILITTYTSSISEDDVRKDQSERILHQKKNNEKDDDKTDISSENFTNVSLIVRHKILIIRRSKGI